MVRKIASGLLCLLLAGSALADEWRLLGSDGCVAVGPQLAARMPEAARIRDPDALIGFLQALGHAVSRQDEYLFCSHRVSVRVPSLGLVLNFSESNSCECAT